MSREDRDKDSSGKTYLSAESKVDIEDDSLVAWAMVNLVETTVEVSGEPMEPQWILDSGATHHITPMRSIMSNIRRLESPMIFGLADEKSTMTAYEVGEVIVRLFRTNVPEPFRTRR